MINFILFLIWFFPLNIFPMCTKKSLKKKIYHGIFEGRVGNTYRVIDEYHKHARGAWQKEMVKKEIGKLD